MLERITSLRPGAQATSMQVFRKASTADQHHVFSMCLMKVLLWFYTCELLPSVIGSFCQD